MLILMILLFPVVEIYSLYWVASRIGIANTFFTLIISALLGAGLIRAQGVFILHRLKEKLARGEVPAAAVLQSLLTFVAGIFFMIPGFVSDIIALILIFPGTRHMLAMWLKVKMLEKIKLGQLKVFSSGVWGKGQRQQPGFRASEPASMRDVTPTIIDVTPLESKASTLTKPKRPATED